MSIVKTYIQHLLAQKGLTVAANKTAFFDEFVADEANVALVNQIVENQQLLMDKWDLKNRITDVVLQPISIPNGTVGKAYSAKIDLDKWKWQDITHLDFEGLDAIGLAFDDQTDHIAGTPTQSGDLKIKMKFRVSGEADDSVLNEKTISLVVNPDPKSLWKTMESDKNAPYWRADDVAETSIFGDKHLVVASKRGRSHANVGSFRDDDFAYKHFPETGWSIAAVADGAGSAKLSRKGAELACHKTIEFFENQFSPALMAEMQQVFEAEDAAEWSDLPNDLKIKIIQELYKITVYVHTEIGNFAKSNENQLKDFHSTLIFCLFKKIPAGYLILSFGVGDCPIALLNPELSEVSLLNWLDVGEYGGGTRFVTMPEIFSAKEMSSRFGVQVVKDFSYLMLMTDGIYDPKFVVEANLEKIDQWQAFLADLGGNNEENTKVDFRADNDEIANELANWLNFWSAGNHDDRTLAIIF